METETPENVVVLTNTERQVIERISFFEHFASGKKKDIINEMDTYPLGFTYYLPRFIRHSVRAVFYASAIRKLKTLHQIKDGKPVTLPELLDEIQIDAIASKTAATMQLTETSDMLNIYKYAREVEAYSEITRELKSLIKSL